MIERGTKNGLLIAAVLAGLSYWAVRNSEQVEPGPTRGLDTRLDYALEDFEMRAFDQKGEIAVKLWAPRFTNEALTEIGRVEQPRLVVDYEGFLWHMMADEARISAGQEQIVLNGNVSVRREGSAPEDRLDLDSSQIVLIVEDRIAHSDQAVRLADAAGILEATGFRVDLKNNEFLLEKNVQGLYEPIR